MIPTLRYIGGAGKNVTFYATHTRFAAGLLADASCELLRISEWIACDFDWYTRLSASERDDDRTRGWMVKAWDRGASARVDSPALIAAAGYSQWLSDHLMSEIVSWRKADLRCVEGYVSHKPDELALVRMQAQEIDEPPKPSVTAPPFPAALKRVLDIDFHRTRLEAVRNTFIQAADAVACSETKRMRIVRTHVDALTKWLEPLGQERGKHR